MQALVIDDSRAIRMILSRILRECGYSVTEAEHGKDALAKLGCIDDLQLVMVDWNMPEMNGYDFLREFRGMDAYVRTPLVMVTSESEEEQVGQAIAAGASGYVTKPFTRDVVRQQLAGLGVPC